LVNEHLKNDAAFTPQWKDKTCCDKLPLPFDFRIERWKTCTQPFVLELDGYQHFVDCLYGPKAFALNRVHDLTKMRWCIARGLPVIRLTSRSVEYHNRATWQAWLTRVRDEHVAPLAGRPVGERKRIVLEDTPLYRTMFAECLEGDSELGPYVLFVHM